MSYDDVKITRLWRTASLENKLTHAPHTHTQNKCLLSGDLGVFPCSTAIIFMKRVNNEITATKSLTLIFCRLANERKKITSFIVMKDAFAAMNPTICGYIKWIPAQFSDGSRSKTPFEGCWLLCPSTEERRTRIYKILQRTKTA